MKRTVLLGALLVLALLISACAPAAATEAPGQSATEGLATSSSEATEPSAATASPAVAATNTGSAAEATASPVVAATSTGPAAGTPATTETPEASVPITGQAEVRAASNFDYGPILVNGDGLPLYIFAQDTQNGDASACTDEECMTEWPPLTTEGDAVAGPGTIQSLLGTITRDDGTTQVTYNGWPLYVFSSDTGSDTTNGQGAEPGWTLVAPSGKPIPAQ